MRTGPDSVSKNRKTVRCLLAAAFIALLFFAMCERSGQVGFVPPAQMLKNLGLMLKLSFADLFRLPLRSARMQLVDDHPYYLETVSRFRNLLITMICGAAIAVGGAVFQILFRNPMAAPNMLGTGSGISLGLIILVLQYSTDAYKMVAQRYIYCLGLAFLMLIIVILMGRFAGKNRTSVTDMLLCGAILAQIMGAVMTWLRFHMDQDDLMVLSDLTLYGFSLNTSSENAVRSVLILIGISAVCLLPLWLMRFSFDAASFGSEESRALGFNLPVVRIVCIIAVTMMVTTATLYCGHIGILGLAVPHVVRFLYGNRFRDVMGGCVFIGAFLLLICRSITSLIYLPGMGFFPLATMCGIVLAPLLAMVLMQKRRGWE